MKLVQFLPMRHFVRSMWQSFDFRFPRRQSDSGSGCGYLLSVHGKGYWTLCLSVYLSVCLSIYLSVLILQWPWIWCVQRICRQAICRSYHGASCLPIMSDNSLDKPGGAQRLWRKAEMTLRISSRVLYVHIILPRGILSSSSHIFAAILILWTFVS